MKGTESCSVTSPFRTGVLWSAGCSLDRGNQRERLPDQESQAGETRATMEQLKADGLEHAVYYSCPGYHELTVCRKSLRQMLPLLFK